MAFLIIQRISVSGFNNLLTKTQIMLKKIKALGFLLLFCAGVAFSQTTVVGNVMDEGGEPVIGASIQVKGTGLGTVTNVNGNFTLTAPSSATTLIISYVGMIPQEVPISPNVQVVLISDTELLDEVVVTAMGRPSE